VSQLTLEGTIGDELVWTYIKKGDPMSLYVLVKSILAADPYYQCINPMMPQVGAQSDSSDQS
jgi:hypothetical protein